MGNEEFMQTERKFYDNLKDHWIKFGKEKGLSEEEIKARHIEHPFQEK